MPDGKTLAIRRARFRILSELYHRGFQHQALAGLDLGGGGGGGQWRVQGLERGASCACAQ